MRPQNLVADLGKDLAYAARTLRNAPSFTITALLTIALGIGASTAIFSVINAVLLHPLPYGNPDRLILADAPVSNAYFFDLRDGTRAAFDDLAAVMVFRAVVPREDGTAERIGKGLITTNFFHMLGDPIMVGRDFTEADGVPKGAPPPPFPPSEGSVAILSYEYFQRRYGGDANVIGRTLPGTGGTGPQIVGVLKPGFTLFVPASISTQPSVDVWIANDRGYDEQNRGELMLHVIGRLNPTVTLDQAQSQVDRIAATWGPDRMLVHLDLWHKELVDEVRPALLALMAAVTFLFLVACANTGNLLLVRTSLRHRELAVSAEDRLAILEATKARVLDLPHINPLACTFGKNPISSITLRTCLREGNSRWEYD
jgi:putative ABC transport system permease protein